MTFNNKRLKISTAIASIMLGSALTLTSLPAISVEALEEIVVTAQKREQNLKDVAASINAVSAESLVNYNIQDFSELESLTSGLFLVPQSASRQTFSIRGLRVDPQSGTQAAVDIYLNDTVINPDIAFSQLYDVSRIEILRGPQGSFQGKTSPAGSIQIHTNDPDFDEFSGYGQVQFGNLSSANIQAAVNMPLSDRLAVRFAANSDQNDGDGVTNIITGNVQDSQSTAYRLSAAWKAFDNLNIVFKYDNIDRTELDSPALAGQRSSLTSAEGEVDGDSGGPLPCSLATANPRVASALQSCTTLTADDRISLAASDSNTDVQADIYNVRADLDLDGKIFTYLFSTWDSTRVANVETNSSSNLELQNALITLDPRYSFGNDFETVQTSVVESKSTVQEFRLQSDNDSNFQYTIGAYLEEQDVGAVFTAPSSSARFVPLSRFPAESLTVPIPANPTLGLPAYDLSLTGGAIVGTHFTTETEVPIKSDTSAIFTHLSYKLGDLLTLEGAIRYSKLEQFRRTDVTFDRFIEEDLIAVQGLTYTTEPPLSEQVTAPTADFVASQFIPGFQDSIVNGSDIEAIPDEFDTVSDEVITGLLAVNVALSDNTSIYVSYNRGYRLGGVSIVPEALVLPLEFLIYEPETTSSYEIGVKTSFWNGRGLLNATYFYQDLQNHFGRVVDLEANTANLPEPPTNPVIEPLAGGITFNGDAISTGVEIESNLLLLDNWVIGLGLTYVNAEFDSAIAPCNDRQPTEFIGSCDVSGSRITGEPEFSFNINSEYTQSVHSNFDAFIRTTYKYKGDVVSTAAQTDSDSEPETVDEYGLLNLYLGLRSSDNDWEVSIWSKNLLDEDAAIDLRNPGGGSDSFDAAGHFEEVLQVQQRTFGVTARYNF